MKADIAIAEQDRKETAEALSRLLADTYALYLRTQNYHWNVVGPRFRELHLMFEQQYEELAAATDEIAERIRILGLTAPATFGEFLRMTSVPQHESVPDADGMIVGLREGHEIVIRTAREVLLVAEKADDHGTADLATARIAYHEKTAWMLAASQ